MSLTDWALALLIVFAAILGVALWLSGRRTGHRPPPPPPPERGRVYTTRRPR